MVSVHDILLILKYVGATIVLICLLLAPAYLAAASGKEKYDCMRARVGSWLFGWSFIGYLFALFVASKK
jgi:hypothetical protein